MYLRVVWVCPYDDFGVIGEWLGAGASQRGRLKWVGVIWVGKEVCRVRLGPYMWLRGSFASISPRKGVE